MIKSHDHDLSEWRFGSGHRQKKTTKNKSRAEQEPRSAHGCVVNNNKSRAEQERRSAHGRAVKKLKKINPVQSNNCAWPMAARLIKRKFPEKFNKVRQG